MPLPGTRHAPPRHASPLALAIAPLLACLMALGVTPVSARPLTGVDWQLLAIDGVVTDIPATLRLEANGLIAGAAPCNSWSTTNSATLPTLRLGGIRATRRACDKLAEEQVFFETLATMTRLVAEGPQTLVLTGPDGRSMEFVLDRAAGQTACATCPPDP